MLQGLSLTRDGRRLLFGRALAQAAAPLFTGLALARAATGLPFFLAGGLKIVYDLALYFRFRTVELSDEEG